ncbi:hypothetical protein [Vibrio viridaestus]|uniref:Uncharacterized protein n=1 Tax=Vibrio viridaestus TaxID=2487322 RepID=A0A3N9TGN7_9VIBR|nr:hypothetical protein [Vibrio viridaestus]RQW63441.1 hypothetical protein EES38_09345 [Vibrio viridaestus]
MNVIEILDKNDHELGSEYESGNTRWIVTDAETPFSLNDNLYLKAIGDVYVEDFNNGILTQSEYVGKAHSYCMDATTNNRLIFDNGIDYTFEKEDSFDIYVESGGWYCSGNCKLIWNDSPTSGYAVRIKGRFDYDSEYASRVNTSNFEPFSGFTIGEYNAQREGIGLQIGYADSLTSTSNGVVTSKFKLSRINIFDFDDVIAFYPGVWACELEHVHTMGGSWTTPTNSADTDFGENIKISHCFIADNHSRLVDSTYGTVSLNSGEWLFEGGSFDNMKVVIGGDACVKMNNPHFENPTSTSMNKRFLEVTGSHAYCVLNSPQIVIRDTYIFSNLFYCVSGDWSADNDGDGYKDRFPFSGGLVMNAPCYQSRAKYRPDMASRVAETLGTSFDSDDTLALIGGSGRIYCNSGAYVNSLFSSNKPIPLSQSLSGGSISNSNFEDDTVGDAANYWVEDTSGSYVSGRAVVSDDYAWAGTNSLKTTVDYNGGQTWNSTHTYQDIQCSRGQLVQGIAKCKWLTELLNDTTGSVTGKILISLKFLDAEKNTISTAWSKTFSVNTEASEETYSFSYDNTDYEVDCEGWKHCELLGSAPDGTAYARVSLVSYSTSNSASKKIHTYWDSVLINVI